MIDVTPHFGDEFRYVLLLELIISENNETLTICFLARKRIVASNLQAANPQPARYERAELSGKASDYWHFRARSVRSVRVYLRRFIGYLLVEPNQGVRAEILETENAVRRLAGSFVLV
jgi:hypothetical protein